MSRQFTPSARLKLNTHGQSNVFRFGQSERTEHVLMKIFIWALYLPHYPDMDIEVRVGDRYKPDVVSIDPTQSIRDVNATIRFWGESGRVGQDKIYALARRYPDTHLVIAKWNTHLAPVEKMVRDAVAGRSRTAPFDLLRFNDGDADRFIDENYHVSLTHDDIEWVRISPEKSDG